VKVTDEFGYRLAALADGEGCFYLGVPDRCAFIVHMRADDADFLRVMRDASGGLGTIKFQIGNDSSAPSVHWAVQSHADLGRIVRIFDQYPLLSKKSHDFRIWREGVFSYQRGDTARLSVLAEHLREARRFEASSAPVPESPQLKLAV
jgi:hypothetical protein